jgi:hypothetical protein
MIVTLNAPFFRLAYPLRSTALELLADNSDELNALTGLIARARAISPDETIKGYIMRPFEFPNPSRFSDGSYGILYAANSVTTAVRETAHHLALIFADGNAPKQETRKKKLAIDVAGNVHDIRIAIDKGVPLDIYDPQDYRAAHIFGREQRKTSIPGLHFDSVRNKHEGHCVGAFTPNLVKHAAIVGDVALIWNGTRFIEEHDISPIPESQA